MLAVKPVGAPSAAVGDALAANPLMGGSVTVTGAVTVSALPALRPTSVTG